MKKRAYILYAVGQSYINKIQSLVEYLLKKSTNDVLLYYSEGAVDYQYDRFKSVYVAIPYLIDFNIPGHRPTAVRNLYLMTYKPDICKDAILNTVYDEFLYLDSDVIPTPNIDAKMEEWSKKCTTYPLYTRYPSDDTFIDDRPLVLDKVINLLGIDRSKKSTFELCAGFFFFKRECLPFIDHWISFVHSKQYTDAFVVPNDVRNHDLCHYTDEGAANALMWYYDYKQFIGPMVWTNLGECVKYVLTPDVKPNKFTYHSEYNSTYFRIPNEYAGLYTRDISIFPLDRKELFAFHGIKNQEEFDKGIGYVEQFY